MSPNQKVHMLTRANRVYCNNPWRYGSRGIDRVTCKTCINLYNQQQQRLYEQRKPTSAA